MKKLQVPYNLDRKVLSVYTAWSEYIAEIYFMAPREVFGSARQYQNYPSYNEYLEEIKIICFTCNNHNMNSMMLLNGNDNIDTDTVDKIVELLNTCSKWNLTGVIVANPVLGEIIHKYFPDLKIRYSILSLESTLGKIKEIEKLGYVKEICLPQDVNRNEDFLIKLKQECPDMNFSTIANVSCRANCPLFFWHQTFYSSSNKNGLFSLNSHDWRNAQLNITNKFTDNNLCVPVILPSELEYYDKYFHQFKLEDRLSSTETLESFITYYALEVNPTYMNNIANSVCTKYNNDQINISKFPEDWIIHRRNCKNECWKCNYCDNIIKDILEE